MKNCHKILNIISQYLDGYLSNSEKVLVEQHLSTCKSCRLEFENVKNVKSKLASSIKYQTLPHFQPVLYAKLREKNSWRQNTILRFRLPVYIGSAAVIVLLSLFFFNQPLDFFEQKSMAVNTDRGPANRIRITTQKSGPAINSLHPLNVSKNSKTIDAPVLVQKNKNDIIYF